MKNRVLVIAEKKNLAQDIANALGRPTARSGYFEVGEYDICYASGHLLKQADPDFYDEKYKKWRMNDLPIIPAQQKKIVRTDKKTGKTDAFATSQLKVLKQLMQSAVSVVNAGDPDREGQIIIVEILQHLNCRLPVKRLWLNAQTPAGIREAFKKMKDDAAFRSLALAAECRAEADWVIGMSCTRGYTLAWQSRGHDGVMNVGRVKSPVIGLVVQRELDIEQFVPKTFYIVKGAIKTRAGNFVAKWVPPKDAVDSAGFDGEGRLLDRRIAQGVVDRTITKMGVIEVADKKRVKQKPPLLLSLGDLQRLAHSFGLSPDQTLKVAQALYDVHKLTTYPRTTCSHAPTDEWKKAPQVLAAVRGNFGSAWDFDGAPDTSRQSGAWDDGKLDAHYAIIPTDMRKDLSGLSREEQIVYRLIVSHWLAQFYPDYEYDTTTLTALVEGERFTATGQTPALTGWRTVIPLKKSAEDEDKQALPLVSKGDPCRSNPVEIHEDQTKPPPRYNGATLLDAMEKAWKFVTDPKVKARLKQTEGIGTPATRSTIIAECISGGFIVEEKMGKANVYRPTQKARVYYQALDADLSRVDLTAYFEGQLEEVEKGSMDETAFKTMLTRLVTRLMAKLKDGSIAAAMPTPQQIPEDAIVSRSRSSTAKTGTRRGGAGSSTRARKPATAKRDTKVAMAESAEGTVKAATRSTKGEFF
ncbi:DNA topoisomerase 3 [Noviherbaspirillum galbum]|uniref:DNA topoisomerase n=1 Tax=Noviherbaspirillum galbum TaxID=2709383 RepID=A0A6B3SRK2_9BURK|nr:DNA topoisomerase 3 [Noviherbaspirillum galbum]NEX63373.1 DNA topoisomerase III [Noviherbaspirillum galbum]